MLKKKKKISYDRSMLYLVYEIPRADSWPQSSSGVWLREDGEGGN